MEAAILTLSGIKKYDNHVKSLFLLEESQRTQVLEAIQQLRLPKESLVVVVEGYTTVLQKTGSWQELLPEEVVTQCGEDVLHRTALVYGGQGISVLRIVFRSDPLVRITFSFTPSGTHVAWL